jgi:hypothetical protein
MAADELGTNERDELERLRAEKKQRGGWGRGGRWLGACVLLLIAALLGGLAVVAVYLRSEVLDTDTYVQTVAPLAQDPPVRQAVATRLADEIVTRSDVSALATQVAERLIAEGAPARVTDLVGPAVSGLKSFLYNEIYKLLGTAKFQTVWEQVNRAAHTGLVTVLTGGQGQFISSSGTTVTVDIGALLSAAKQDLAAQGLSFVSRIPDVSINYQLVESDELPKLRTYTRLLNTAGTWLPFVALALLIAGILAAPNRRRGIITGAVMLGIVAALLLAVLAIGRTYYLDNLPPAIRSYDAAASVIDTMLRYLKAALQTLIVVAVIFVVAGWLAGPSRPATAIRRLVGRGLDAAGQQLSRAGSWAVATGRALAGLRLPIQIAVVIAALLALIIANRPSIATVLWATVVVLVLFAILEIFIRTSKPPAVPRPS